MKKSEQSKAATYPRLSRQVNIGNLGIEVVTSIISNQLEWLFRKVHQEEDFGIDGYIDIVTDRGYVTGQSIAVQIKCGQTFFSAETNVGFVFKGKRKHLNYYLNNRHPILIILCDPETRVCYFEIFDAAKTESTTKGWKMIIPRTNLLGAKIKADLVRLVGDPVDHLPALETHWALTSLMGKMERILFAIDRADIESVDTTSITKFISRITSNLILCEKLQGKLDISVSGYDDDVRELWEIPEVKMWFWVAGPIVKHWFYFLSTDGRAAGLRTLMYCSCEALPSGRTDDLGRREFLLDTQSMAEFAERNFMFLKEMTDRLHMPLERNRKISFSVMRIFGWFTNSDDL